jgi:hypothetical protein
VFVTRENVAALVEQGLLPEGNLCFHIISGADGVRMPTLSTLDVRWIVARDTPHGVVTQQSENYPPFTFYEWNDLEVERYDGDVVLRFVVRTLDETIPVEVLVMRERIRSA